jgi:hypothetical protein
MRTSTDATKEVTAEEGSIVKCTRIFKGGGGGGVDTNNKIMFNIGLKLLSN